MTERSTADTNCTYRRHVIHGTTGSKMWLVRKRDHGWETSYAYDEFAVAERGRCDITVCATAN